MAPSETVLVTGGTGFIASHCVLQTLLRGYNVRTTLRSLKSIDTVREMLREGGASDDQIQTVDFFAANLTDDAGWKEACNDCTYILHVASPFPPTVPKDENDLIVPAREGTLRVLRAGKAAGTVKRIVVTSSVAAIAAGYDARPESQPFSEIDWSRLDNPNSPAEAYPKSKTLAERAAWNWIEEHGDGMELATVNPTAVFGPMLSKHYASSIELVSRLVNGKIPALPQLSFGVVDVRDVADLHLRAMTDPKAAGERFIAAADGGALSVKGIALALKERLSKEEGRRISTIQAPNFAVRLLGLIDPTVAMIVPSLGKRQTLSNEKSKNELGWRPRSAEDALVASAQSLRQFGLAP